jgi:hypothetical protein
LCCRKVISGVPVATVAVVLLLYALLYALLLFLFMLMLCVKFPLAFAL